MATEAELGAMTDEELLGRYAAEAQRHMIGVEHGGAGIGPRAGDDLRVLGEELLRRLRSLRAVVEEGLHELESGHELHPLSDGWIEKARAALGARGRASPHAADVVDELFKGHW